ncbi:DNA alkylation repair protein [Gordonia sp. zg691]|uniref:DNA alkylation repair protein n=1 Tax=Gordonia jinghuaiqii TaxID=2758710 RepID=UPI00166249E4|nr:DNA alkylation repair protein [Gordonia jinghuaiqii]MBD0860997.1 DNA alkylation repair protein [Gordonia jinghuaiqii]
MVPEPTAAAVRTAAAEIADPQLAAGQAKFFQARPGGYGEGDEFLGLRVPQQRAIARAFRGIGPDAVAELLDSPVHEHRLIALFLLRGEFEQELRRRGGDATDAGVEVWVKLYLDAVRRGRVNNWDLVDSSADSILGEYCRRLGRLDAVLRHAQDEDLWRRRVGIIATFAHIRHGDATALLAVAPLVRDDRRDLIQKAFGWMLREVGKRVDEAVLLGYLGDNAAEMGRTALSYAIEHRSPEERAYFRSLR